MSKEDFEAFDFGQGEGNCQFHINSAVSKKESSVVNDELSSKRMNSSTEISLKGSNEVSREYKASREIKVSRE